MTLLVSETNDLVFDRGAVARAFAVDDAAVDGGEMEVVANELVGFCCCSGDVTAHLFTAHPSGGIKGKEAIGSIAGLFLKLIEGNAASVYPGRGTRFEAIGVKAEALQGFGETLCCLFAGTACGHGLVTHPDAASQKGSGGEDDGFGCIHSSEVSPNALDALLLSFSFHLEAGHHRLTQSQIRGVLQKLQHLSGVQPLVGLRT